MSATGIAAPEALLSARLTVRYPGKTPVLNGIALDIGAGEVVGLVGQSGSGKSTLAMALMGLLGGKRATIEGSILFQGTDLLPLAEREWRSLRGRSISLVLQSPLSALNPALRIQTQLREAWRAHAAGGDAEPAIESAMKSVSLPSTPEFLRKYPSQLSVGQAQRVLIAMAVLHRPALLIADEATSALDVITQAEVLELFARLSRENGMSILYISHDLPSVAGICQRLAILHEGQIVESGPAARIFASPEHPYTRRLMNALPRMPESGHSRAEAASAGTAVRS